MFIYSRILNEEGKEGGGQRAEVKRRQSVLDQALQDSCFHYTVLNLFIHHFSIQNPFSRNINAPTELESSAGGEKMGREKKKTKQKKNKTTKTLRRENMKKKQKNKTKGSKKKSIFYIKNSSVVITMIIINYLCLYIYTHIFIYIYICI